MTTKQLEILDCTIRDGGYLNNWWFDQKMVREVYRALSKSGVDYIELGFRGTTKYFDPTIFGAWRFTSEEDLRDVTEGIQGAKIVLMGDHGKIDIEDIDEKENSIVDLIRIAAHKNQIFNAIDFLDKVKSKGYMTSLQAMGFTGYTKKEKDDLKKAMKGSGLDYFYIADSYGSILPSEIQSLFDPFLNIDPIKIGFHPHNSLQMAFANTLEAIRIGVDIVDSTIYGMGRGAGNLPTEALIAYMQLQKHAKYNVIPILGCIEKYFVELAKEVPWGYQLSYLISGMFKCHPYYAEDLVDRREYSIEDIWKALEIIDDMNPTGFDRQIIEKMISRGVLSGGRKTGREQLILSKDMNEGERRAVPYVSRHTGRDFLILANGPTLSKHRDQIQSFIEKYDPIILGANYLSNLFVPHYHAFNNKKRFTMYLDSVNQDAKLLIGENIPSELVREYVKGPYEILQFRDVLDSDFDIRDGRIQSSCRTISVLLLGVAIVMGAKRIFIAGMDGYLNKDGIKNTLFYHEKFEPDDITLNMDRHHWNEKFLHQIDQYIQKQGHEGIHIITPTTHQAFYKGIDNYI